MPNIREITYLEFFDSPNYIPWEKVKKEDFFQTQKKYWLDWQHGTLRQNRLMPLFIPFKKNILSNLTWYVICTDIKFAREMAEVLQAFIGQAFCDYANYMIHFENGQNIDENPFQLSDCYGYKFTVIDDGKQQAIYKAIKRLCNLREQIPIISNEFMSTRQILYNFKSAISLLNRNEALKYLDILKNENRLNRENSIFQEIKFYREFGEWDKIVSGDWLCDIIKANHVMPKFLAETILIALFNTEFFKAELANNSHDVPLFSDIQLQKYSKLFVTSNGIKDDRALKCLSIAFVSDNCSNVELSRELLKRKEIYAFIIKLQKLGLWKLTEDLKINESKDDNSFWQDLENDIADGKYLKVWNILISIDLDYKSFAFLLECAVNIGTLSVAEQTLNCFSKMEERIKERILNNKSKLNELKELENLTYKNKSVDNILDWLNNIQNEDFSAISVLEKTFHQWKKTAEYSDKEIHDLADKILDLQLNSSNVRNIIIESIPMLLEYFGGLQGGIARYTPIYDAFCETLLLDTEGFSEIRYGLINSLLYLSLQVEPKKKIQNYIRSCWHIWKEVCCSKFFDNIIDQLDLFQEYASTIPSDFFADVLYTVVEWKDRCLSHQLTRFKEICYKNNFESQYNALIADSLAKINKNFENEHLKLKSWLDGKTVVVYSLDENVLRLTKVYLEKEYSGLIVKLNSDRVRTIELENYAKNADFFVFSTGKAKHAAYYAAKEARDKVKKELIYPSGNGFSSIISSLIEHWNSIALTE